jgi:alkylation response protein AidB-like acyl-CoA dehydrogenase
MDLTFTEEQDLLRQTVRDVMGRYSAPADVRALEDDATGFRKDLWAELQRLDLLSLGLDPSLMLEASIVAEELGRAICPSPYIETAIFAARLVPDRVERGEVVTLAWHEADRSEGEDGIALRAENGALTGEKILVPFAVSANAIITLARGDEGVGLYLVDAGAVEIEPMGTLAKDARSIVRFDAAPAERIGDWPSFEAATTPALVAVASYAIGGAEAAHAMATAYAIERIQFDRPIGAFQGVAHPLADMAAEITGAQTLVHQAAWTIATGRPNRALAAMAKYAACDAFRKTTKVGHQVFGGIGFTLDIDIQLFLRRAKQLEVTWFGPRYLEQVVAGAELDDPTPLVSPDAVASGASEPVAAT